MNCFFLISQTNAWQQVFVPPNFADIYTFAAIGNTLYAGGETGVYRSTDNGQTWNNVLPTLSVENLLVDGTNLFAGGTTSSLGNVYVTSNGGANWSDITPNTFTFFGNNIKSMLVNGSYLYIGAGQGYGIYRCLLSNLNSYAWTTYSVGFNGWPQGATLGFNGTNLVAAMFSGGFYTSPPTSPSWSNTSTGITNSTFMRALAITNSTLLIGTAGAPQLHRSVNGGSTWAPLNTSAFSNSSEVRSIKTNGNDIYVATNIDGVMYSNDNGTSWTSYNQGFKDATNNWYCNNMRVFALFMKGDTLYAGTSCGIWRSSGCSNPAVLNTQQELSFCGGGAATLTVSGLGQLSWYTSPTATTSIASGSILSIPTITNSTTYYVQNNFCDTRTPVTVTINAIPEVLLAISTTTVCAATQVTITALGANSYLWNDATSSQTKIVTPGNTTTYTVTGTSAEGCIDTETITIHVLPVPSLSLTASSTLVCQGESVLLSASGANSYAWNTADVTPSATVFPLSTTLYNVTGVGIEGCTATKDIEIAVSICAVIEPHATQQQSIQCYPNPTSGKFTLTGFENGSELEILNEMGIVVFDAIVQSYKVLIDFNGKEKGMYFYRITTSKNKIAFGKIILE